MLVNIFQKKNIKISVKKATIITRFALYVGNVLHMCENLSQRLDRVVQMPICHTKVTYCTGISITINFLLSLLAEGSGLFPRGKACRL